MSKWAILLCILFAVEGEITQLERERTLCILNEIRREFLNCYPSKSALSTKLKWNLTLEYYANVYSRHLCMKDRNIPRAYDFNEYKDLTFMDAELDKYDYNKPSWHLDRKYKYCNDSTRLITHAECNAGSTWNRASGLVKIFGSQMLLFLWMSAITINQA
ncbi:hypothetical protein PHET_08395 [Paragonimus heterotremus]|uniref:Uncharacterized protein n=1 Tax=Paragonimus heterotremus TaxID=100268 RepID=A0A8J4SWW8_9TREM|nr:hypothetical protein PHET_08395 [Paragonimus heterotremus]